MRGGQAQLNAQLASMNMGMGMGVDPASLGMTPLMGDPNHHARSVDMQVCILTESLASSCQAKAYQNAAYGTAEEMSVHTAGKGQGTHCRVNPRQGIGQRSREQQYQGR